MTEEQKNLAGLIDTSLAEDDNQQALETIDFKMVTFSLGGKDYGVDIMNVKEIAKADKFTYVPNTASYVKGVYNLRGDIIPIIDLRSFFHLPTTTNADGQDNMLIIQIEDRVYGTVVDKIDKVVGLNSSHIQPPHPIFGDINIKFIRGVVQKEGDLYLILDMVRIFSTNKDDEKKDEISAVDSKGAGVAQTPKPSTPALTTNDLDFVRDQLKTLKNFYSSPVNDIWVQKYFTEWAEGKSGASLQIKSQDEAEEFLTAFYSPSTAQFWTADYASALKSVLPNMPSSNIQAWNLGCGKGYETYSFACILKDRYPGAYIKIWANDNDLMAITNAPNMTFNLDELPDYIKPYMVKGKNGYSFNQDLKDSCVFEYHDVLNGNNIPQVDIVLVRDMLSFISIDMQDKLISDIADKLKKGGIVITGRNESMPVNDWQSIGQDPVAVFVKE
jgi:purine-binding chemotaxis protein CheW